MQNAEITVIPGWQTPGLRLRLGQLLPVPPPATRNVLQRSTRNVHRCRQQRASPTTGTPPPPSTQSVEPNGVPKLAASTGSSRQSCSGPPNRAQTQRDGKDGLVNRKRNEGGTIRYALGGAAGCLCRSAWRRRRLLGIGAGSTGIAFDRRRQKRRVLHLASCGGSERCNIGRGKCLLARCLCGFSVGHSAGCGGCTSFLDTGSGDGGSRQLVVGSGNGSCSLTRGC
jgi:hypothetical protein